MNEASEEQLEESLRGHESLSGVDNFNDLTKKFIEYGDTIKTLQGDIEGRVNVPGEDASDEERKTYRDSINKYLGVPETVEGYEIAKPDGLPDGMIYDDALADRMLNTLHKSGAPKELAHAIMKDYNEYNIDLHSKFNEYVKETSEKDLNALKDHWKGDFEKKNSETFEVLLKAAEKINIPESMGGMKGFIEDIENTGMKNNPRFNVFFNSLFDLVGIDEVIKGSKRLGGEDPTKPKVFSSYKDM